MEVLDVFKINDDDHDDDLFSIPLASFYSVLFCVPDARPGDVEEQTVAEAGQDGDSRSPVEPAKRNSSQGVYTERTQQRQSKTIGNGKVCSILF